jgi:hypothetical protein
MSNIATATQIQLGNSPATEVWFGSTKIWPAVEFKLGTMPSTSMWDSVVYGGGKFVAFANTRAVSPNQPHSTVTATSSDGVTWTAATRPSSLSGPVAYGNAGFLSRFVMLEFSANIIWDAYGSGYLPGSNRAFYSDNGTSWTQVTLPSTCLWNSVAFGSSKFVAVGTTNTFPNVPCAAYSWDGVTWTSFTMPDSGWNIFFGGSKFIAFGPNDKMGYSSDGTTWTYITVANSGTFSSSIAYGNGKYVAVGSYSATSTDGITWTRSASPLPVGVNCVDYELNRFVALQGGSSGGKFLYSSDGLNWSSGTMPGNVAYATGKYALASSGGGKIVAVADYEGAFNTNKMAYLQI